MYDLSQPNEKPGACRKCSGSGVYRWGATVNGVSQHSGECYSCRGTGKQSAKQIRRNHTYNRHKLSELVDRDFVDVDALYEAQCAEICGR